MTPTRPAEPDAAHAPEPGAAEVSDPDAVHSIEPEGEQPDPVSRGAGSRDGGATRPDGQAAADHDADDAPARVSTLELFFDLVFVFTITQLTHALVSQMSWGTVVRVLLMLWIIWWMYDGYTWLVNVVNPHSGHRRGLLLLAMAGFLVVALAIPHAFDSAGWAFGAGYLLVNLVHTGLFRHGGGPGAMRALAILAPLNLTSAGLVLAGGFLSHNWRFAAWTAALVVQVISPYLHPIGGFRVSPAHFVERHGLVIIIALGESVVATGAALYALPLHAEVFVVAVLGLVLTYLLWWAYFGVDDARAEHALMRIQDRQERARAALRGFGYAHFPMLFGVVAFAAGVRTAIPHIFRPSGLPSAIALGGGIAVFLFGHVWFRHTLRLARSPYRVAAALAALVTIPLGLLSSAHQLFAVTAALAVILFIESRREHTVEITPAMPVDAADG